jgi:hypothetical protein
MKLKLFYSVLALSLVTLISACDDEETPITGIQFEVDEQEVNESDGTLQSFHPEINVDGIDDNNGRVVPVTLSFDRALAGDVVIKFDISGSARSTATSTQLSDYSILEESDNLTVDGDEITILNGTEEASFSVVVYEDLSYEYDEDGDFNADDVPLETITIELESIVSGPGKLGTELEHTLKILEDDVIAYLAWDPQDMDDASNDVDMDLFVSFDNGFGFSSVQIGIAPESILIPAGIGTGEVSMAYNYYSGSSNDLLYEAGFYSLAGTLEGDQFIAEPLAFQGTYTAANINPYDVTEVDPKIAQTAEKDGINYANFSSLNSHPDGGSRSKLLRPFQLTKAQLSRMAQVQTNVRSLTKSIERKK